MVINISEANEQWIDGENECFAPEDGEICLVLPTEDSCPLVCIYEAETERFWDISEGYMLANADVDGELPDDYVFGFFEKLRVCYWREMRLPENTRKSIKAQWEEWS